MLSVNYPALLVCLCLAMTTLASASSFEDEFVRYISNEAREMPIKCAAPPMARFIVVAGIGLVAGSALTISSPLSSALLTSI